jgi:hypothetical protein
MSNTTVRELLNKANPNILADLFRDLGIADLFLGQSNQHLRNLDPDVAGANPYDLSTEDTIVLPDNAKASRILRCTVRAGGATGEFTEKAGYGTTPTTGTVGVTPNGNIAFIATDAVTDADVSYVSERGDVLELTLPVVSGTGVLALPDSVVEQGVILLLEAESLAGTLVSKMIVLVPSNSAPATTKALLTIPKHQVLFAVADAVTRARVKLLLCPAKDLQNVLGADAQYT